MTILDWRYFQDATPTTPANHSLSGSRNAVVTTPAFAGEDYPVVIGGSTIYPAYGTVNGRRATGWNEGLLEYWQFHQNDSDPYMVNILKAYPLSLAASSYYYIIWGPSAGGPYIRASAFINGTIVQTQVGAGVIFGPADNQWDGMRTQFRWTSMAKTAFEIKCWGNTLDGQGWRQILPGAGTFTFTGSTRVPDSNNCIFALGGGEINNSLNRRSYFDNIRLSKVPFPPL